MFTPTVQKKPSNVLVIKVDPSKVSKGHSAHRSGSGTHDSRPNRIRTREAQRRAALSEY